MPRTAARNCAATRPRRCSACSPTAAWPTRSSCPIVRGPARRRASVRTTRRSSSRSRSRCTRATAPGSTPGMRVGVIGAGTIGLLSGAVARHLGAEVAIVARHDAQRAGRGSARARARERRPPRLRHRVRSGGHVVGIRRRGARVPAGRARSGWCRPHGSRSRSRSSTRRCARSRSCPRSSTARRTATASSRPRPTIAAAHPEIAAAADHPPVRPRRRAARVRGRGRPRARRDQGRACTREARGRSTWTSRFRPRSRRRSPRSTSSSSGRSGRSNRRRQHPVLRPPPRVRAHRLRGRRYAARRLGRPAARDAAARRRRGLAAVGVARGIRRARREQPRDGDHPRAPRGQGPRAAQRPAERELDHRQLPDRVDDARLRHAANSARSGCPGSSTAPGGSRSG